MSQQSRILDYLKTGKSLTTFEAYDILNITTLGQRCTDLRRAGYDIKDTWEEKNGKRYKRYFMDTPDEFEFTDRLQQVTRAQG